MKKRMIFFFLALIMLLGLFGCQLSVEDQIAKSLLKWQQIETMDVEVELVLELEIPGETVTMNTNIDIAFDNGRQKSMTGATITMLQMTQSMKTYVEMLENGEMMAATDYGGGWVEQEMPEQPMGIIQGYDAKESVDLYLDNIKSFEDAGMEELNGKKARKITGTLTGDSLKSAMRLSMGAMGNTIGNITDDGLPEELQDVPITLWIDPQSHYVIKMDTDIKDLFSSIIHNMLQGAVELGIEINFSACSMTTTVNTINSDAFDFDRIQKPSVDGGKAALQDVVWGFHPRAASFF